MPAPSPWGRARTLPALLVVPVLLFGPILAAGQVFLPFLPAGHEPLASEDPAAAAEAMRASNGTLGDRVYPFLVDQLEARAELAAGHLPTWEPLETLGMPLFGGGIAALGYPPNWLALLLPPEHAAAPLALLALFLAGLGLLLFLLRLGLDPRAALLGALGFQLGTWGLANLHYYMKVDAALWLPWALWAVEGVASGKRWSATALVLAVGASVLGGMVTISAFVLGATALYALLRIGRSSAAGRAGLLLRTGVLLVLGVASSAYWLWPLAEAGGASLRGRNTIATGVAGSLPPATSLGLLVPDPIGPPGDPTPPESLPLAWWLTPASMSERAQFASVLEWNTHAPLALVLLALVGLVATPRRAAFPALLLLGTFAFAQAWPVVRWLYALPGLGYGSPARVLALAWLLWPWLAALGVEALLARAPRALPTLLSGAFVAALALFLAWQALEPAAWARELPATILERYAGRTSAEEVAARLPFESALAAARHLQESLARAWSMALALCLAGALALLLDRRRPRFESGPGLPALALGGAALLACAALPFALYGSLAAHGPQALLGLSAVLALAGIGARTARADLVLWFPSVALLLLDGFIGSSGHVQGRAILGDGLFPPSPSIEAVREAAGDGRVLRLGSLAEATRLARPNMLVPYGIAELTPYPTFTPRQPVELAGRLDARMTYRNHVAPLPALELVGHPLLDLLRVQCLLSVTPVQHPRLVPLLERPGFCVYRRLGALGVARIVPAAAAAASDEEVLGALLRADADYARTTRIAPEHAGRILPFVPGPDWAPGTIAAVERPARNRLLVRVSGSRGGWLVVHEQWARGWEARVDGQQAPLLRADHAYRAVPIPVRTDGELVVELRYRPPALEWGAVIALVAVLGVLARELLDRD